MKENEPIYPVEELKVKMLNFRYNIANKFIPSANAIVADTFDLKRSSHIASVSTKLTARNKKVNTKQSTSCKLV